MANKKSERHHLIVQLIAMHDVTSQEQLVGLLAKEGVEVAQTTLSRDLTELNVLKGANGYVVQSTQAVKSTPNSIETLKTALRQFVVSIKPAASIVVLKTNPGHAQLVGLELDRVSLEEVVGNVSGDDTIFIATPSERAAQGLAETMFTWINEN